MPAVRCVFMGSDAFSLPVLQALITNGRSDGALVSMTGVVTQPDRPAGRGRKVAANAVKATALEAGIPVLQPQRLRDAEARAALAELRPQLIVVASFGQILPRAVLDIPEHGSLNLHPSLLPRYRGSSPIVAPLLAGDTVTGTTLMLMALKMDAGPILAQESTPIGEEETAGELEVRLACLSADVLMRELARWLRGEIRPLPQDESRATYTERVTKTDGLVDWTQPASFIARQVRAYNPWPAAFTPWSERTLRLLRAHELEGRRDPGAVLGLRDGALLVGTGDGLLAVSQLQLAGGRPLPADVFVRGHADVLDARLG